MAKSFLPMLVLIPAVLASVGLNDEVLARSKTGGRVDQPPQGASIGHSGPGRSQRPAAARRRSRRQRRLEDRGSAPENKPSQVRSPPPPCATMSPDGLPKGAGFLVGNVSRGPMTPVEGLGRVGREPVPGVEVVISDLEGAEIERVVTDAAGNYCVQLPPAAYRVALLTDLKRSQRARTAAVIEGQSTRLDLLIDTGIR